MEIVPEGRNFRLVTEEELPAVADQLVQYMPESLKFHQTIKTYLNNKVWEFHFYVAKNWPEEPICIHFPGCTTTPDRKAYESVTLFCPSARAELVDLVAQEDVLLDLTKPLYVTYSTVVRVLQPDRKVYESVTLFCPSARAELVDLVAQEDVLLDLTKPLYVNFTHESLVARLERRYEAREKIRGDIYVCDNPPTEFNMDELPADVQLVRLRPEHMISVHDLYPAADIECIEVFKRLVAELPAFGIFVEGELAAWMVQSYYGAMFSMQTRPEFRRKGYGIYLARYLTKEVAARGYKPFVVIRPENEASKSLYAKLGFEKRFQTVRAVLHPRESLD